MMSLGVSALITPTVAPRHTPCNSSTPRTNKNVANDLSTVRHIYAPFLRSAMREPPTAAE